jgi:hypothetical protein
MKSLLMSRKDIEMYMYKLENSKQTYRYSKNILFVLWQS